MLGACQPLQPPVRQWYVVELEPLHALRGCSWPARYNQAPQQTLA